MHQRLLLFGIKCHFSPIIYHNTSTESGCHRYHTATGTKRLAGPDRRRRFDCCRLALLYLQSLHRLEQVTWEQPQTFSKFSGIGCRLKHLLQQLFRRTTSHGSTQPGHGRNPQLPDEPAPEQPDIQRLQKPLSFQQLFQLARPHILPLLRETIAGWLLKPVIFNYQPVLNN